MPITITNTLTGERWVYPDSVAQTLGAIDLGGPPFTPGLYDIRNSSDSGVAVMSDGPGVTVPDGDTLLDHLPHTWSICNNGNLYSKIQVDGDYWGIMGPSTDRGKPWAAPAVPLLGAWLVPDVPPGP